MLYIIFYHYYLFFGFKGPCLDWLECFVGMVDLLLLIILSTMDLMVHYQNWQHLVYYFAILIRRDLAIPSHVFNSYFNSTAPPSFFSLHLESYYSILLVLVFSCFYYQPLCLVQQDFRFADRTLAGCSCLEVCSNFGFYLVQLGFQILIVKVDFVQYLFEFVYIDLEQELLH